jgi:SAM-dependent methyltransferase
MTKVSNISNSISCPVCFSEAKVIYREHPGYQKPKVYDIVHCESCNTSFANPLGVDPDLYDLVYSKPDEIPGYDRYSKYAQNVLKKNNPLEYLAKSEDTYWSIKNYLDNTPDSTKKRILEVGCGLGYLTYSMIKAGFNVTGLDISMNAIVKATARYGKHFVCADLHEYGQKTDIKYDTIILTEVIEHVPNIYEILSSLTGLLSDGGEIVITTPNKSSFSTETVWYTDLPPIHLWWLSEASMSQIADKIGYSVKFTDFSKCNSLNVSKRINHSDGDDKLKWIKKSIVDEEGNLIVDDKINSSIHKVKKSLHSLGILPKLKVVMSGLPILKENFLVGKRREVLCAIFSRDSSIKNEHP